MKTRFLLLALVLIGALLVVSCSSEDAPASSASLISIGLIVSALHRMKTSPILRKVAVQFDYAANQYGDK